MKALVVLTQPPLAEGGALGLEKAAPKADVVVAPRALDPLH